MKKGRVILFSKLEKSVNELVVLGSEREKILQVLIDYIQVKKDNKEAVNLNFICTHNSRRSQFSQIWGQTAADYYGVVTNCFSGGVEVTAFNERAVESIRRIGFTVSATGEVNPMYKVLYGDNSNPILAFSKLYNHQSSPVDNFAAIMTCSHADENCPFIPGTEERIPVRYDDPKAFDDTEFESDKYDERSLQIASEMFYVFSKIK
jgi:arsenate reductase